MYSSSVIINIGQQHNPFFSEWTASYVKSCTPGVVGLPEYEEWKQEGTLSPSKYVVSPFFFIVTNKK